MAAAAAEPPDAGAEPGRDDVPPDAVAPDPVPRWDEAARGVVQLPSGRRIRGRALRRPLPGGPHPTFGLYLGAREPDPVPWTSRWVQWPDLRLPADSEDAEAALREAWERAAHERVEVGCGGGKGRTGTALARIAVLDGVPAADAVGWIREHYDGRAVETPWQARWVRRRR